MITLEPLFHLLGSFIYIHYINTHSFKLNDNLETLKQCCANFCIEINIYVILNFGSYRFGLKIQIIFVKINLDIESDKIVKGGCDVCLV